MLQHRRHNWLVIVLLCVWSCIGGDGALGSPLWDAVKVDDVAGVESILASGDLSDLNTKGNGGQTPLMFSVLSGKFEMVKLLHANGADTSIPEKDGYTPLHGAGFQGRAEIAKYLINDAGLDPFDMHTDGFTPIHRACWGTTNGHTETVRVLMETGGVPGDLASADGKLPKDMTRNPSTLKLLKEWEGRHARGDVHADL
jgi:ankyrin repeat protein